LNRFRQIMILALSMVAVGFAVWIVQAALFSELFVARTLEVEILKSHTDFDLVAPLDSKAIEELTQVQLGSQNLAAIDLRRVEQSLRSNPWIRNVQLQKRFPSTLKVTVDFRVPQAIVQEKDEPLMYLDQDYEVQVPVQAEVISNLPIIHLKNRPQQKMGLFKEIGSILTFWSQSSLFALAEVSGFEWSEAVGLRALLLYKNPSSQEPARTWLEIGQYYGSQLFDDLQRLPSVINYLTIHEISATQIFLAGSKKIVVKTAPRS
jgi:hypothetical protein